MFYNTLSLYNEGETQYFQGLFASSEEGRKEEEGNIQ